MPKQSKKPGRKVFVRFHPGVILAHRVKHGWSQADLALEADISKETVGRIERGQGTFALDTAGKLAACFNVDVESIADICTDAGDLVFEAEPRDMSYLFDDMMKELSDIIGKEDAHKAMSELFWRMQNFPFGKDKRDELYKRKRYDLDAFITILEFRARAILWTLQSISGGWIKLREGERQERIMSLEDAKALAAEWEEHFTKLHESHVNAIRDGNLLLAHEIRQEIADLLNTIYWSYRYVDPRLFSRGLIYSSH
jgi:DNA-binding XRE family transcriptional regulator